MAILKRDLQAVRRDFKALERKMEKLLKAAEKAGAAKKVTKSKAVKTKTAKPKKTRATTAKRATRTTRKRAPQVTATDQILRIIRRSKKGVDVPTLKKKTGFDDKKVRNIVFRASKEGRIKKSGRGIYVGA